MDVGSRAKQDARADTRGRRCLSIYRQRHGVIPSLPGYPVACSLLPRVAYIDVGSRAKQDARADKRG